MNKAAINIIPLQKSSGKLQAQGMGGEYSDHVGGAGFHLTV